MAIKVTYDGLIGIMSTYLGNTDPLKLFLYSNNYVPVNNSLPEDFTAITASGLGQQALATSESVITITPPRVYYSFPDLVFTAAGSGLPVTAYGYVVWNEDQGIVIWAEYFTDFDHNPAPIVISNAGEGIHLFPRVSLRSEF